MPRDLKGADVGVHHRKVSTINTDKEEVQVTSGPVQFSTLTPSGEP